MILREAAASDWPDIYPFLATIVATGKTDAYPEALSRDQARPWWMEQPPGRVGVAADGGVVVGSAKMGPNRPGRGSRVATASSCRPPPQRQGRRPRMATGVVDWAGAAGYRSIQFNAAVETNAAAVARWQSLGFEILMIVPEAFRPWRARAVGLHVMLLRLQTGDSVAC